MGTPAARVGDEVAHSNAMMGLLIGAALGAALAVAVVATGGLAAVAAGAMIAGGLAGGALAGEYIGGASMGPPTGSLMIGSPNVFINGKPATMTNIAMAICAKEYGVPQPIAQGAATVFINGMPAGRKNDKLVCGAVIIDGSPDVFFDDRTVQTLPIAPEVPAWLNNTLQVVAIGAAIVGFGAAIAAVGLGAACAGLLGSLTGGWLGKEGGRALGDALGLSEGATRALEVVGGLGGSIAGGVGATRAFQSLGENPIGTPTPASEDVCTSGCPISMHTGEELLAREDFVWQGPLTLAWTRFYRTSQSGTDLQLGHGWITPLDEWIEPADDGGLTYHDHEGRRIRLPLPRVGEHGVNTAERLRVTRSAQHVRLRPRRGPDRLFRLTARRSGLQAWIGVDGHRIDLVRDERGLVVALHGSWGAGMIVHRQGARILGLSPARRTPLGSQPAGMPVVRYFYDAHGDLVRALDRLDQGEHYAYDGHLLARRTLPSGFNFHFEWDAAGPHARCVRNWGDQGIYDYRFEWEAAGTSRAIDSRGGVTEYEYAPGGQLLRVTGPEGATQRFRYTAHGCLAEVTGPQGTIARYEVDAEGRVTRITDAAGGARSLAYEPDGQLAELTDALGNAWRWIHDEHGRLREVVDPTGAATRYRFNAQGLLGEVTDALGRRRMLWWDERARLVAELGFDGVRRRFAYDAFDRIVGVTTQDQRVLHYEWDDADRLVAIQSPGGGRIEMRYNALGRLTHWRDANGNVTEYRYADGLHQPSERIDPLGHVLRYRYDTERNLVGLANAKGEVHTLAWDKCRRLVEQVGFDGRRQRYRYDDAGALVARAEEAGVDEAGRPRWRVTGMQRDRAGRLIEKTLADGVSLRYGYDPMGRVTEARRGDHAVRFGYDALGRLTQELQDGELLAHDYDALGQRSKTVLPDGQVLCFVRDENGALAEVTLNGDRVSQHRWDEFAQESGRVQGALETRFAYDPNGQLVAQQTVDAASRTLLARRYVRDAAGHIEAIDDLRQGTARYLYDPAERLVAVEGATREQFVHDPAGNLLGQGDGLAEGDRLIMQGDRHFAYDAAGDLVEERSRKGGRLVTRYEHDAEHRLIAVSTAGETVRYEYDALGRRVRKTTRDVDTRFFWDGVRLVGEASTAIDERTPRTLRWYVYEPASFRPLALVESRGRGAAANEATASPRVYHYHLDHLGTPREMTDARGRIVWSGRYRAWGALALADVREIDNPLRFAGQYHDAETGLHYGFQRYYDPRIGRFIQQDPIGLAGGDNVYAYAPNPIGWVDPLGLACANVDAEGTLTIKNKFPPGSAEDAALKQHVADWNDQIQANGGSMTRQAVTPAMRASADEAAAAARAANPADYPSGMVAGHTPDVAWGGSPGGPIQPLNSSVNSYVGGATQAVKPGTVYNNVTLN